MILRVIDANLNRCREGLRIIEDYFRFIAESDSLRKKIRKIRHSLEKALKDKNLVLELIKARDTAEDSGKGIDRLELKRKNSFDLIYANFQRAKESARVLEEMFKILDKSKVKIFKKIRYEIYAAEKIAFENRSFICTSR